MSHLDPDPIVRVLQRLLGPEGCPWDREQTPHSLCEYLVEEVFELVDAVRGGKEEEIRDELGDVSFLLFFLAELLFREQGIDLQQVWEQSAAKMQRRHPHVFGSQSVATREELRLTWERVKSEEREASSTTRRHSHKIASLAASLPPLPKAYRIHAKAAQSGFTWESDREQTEALSREWREWEEVRESEDHSRMEEEFGDLLFSLVEHGRRKGIKANAALDRANQKFLRRFQRSLALAGERGLDWEGLTMREKDRLWDEAKMEERGQQDTPGASSSPSSSGEWGENP